MRILRWIKNKFKKKPVFVPYETEEVTLKGGSMDGRVVTVSKGVSRLFIPKFNLDGLIYERYAIREGVGVYYGDSRER